MSGSPKRADPLRDAEARVRALTREVGTLREDLRREVKRRERAVAQAKEHEEARQQADARAAELSYSNRKLSTELDTLHEAARSGAERDRRALRGLREGLAAVEAAVASRRQQGATEVRLLAETHAALRQLLLGSSGGNPSAASGSGTEALLANVTGLSSAAAPKAEALMAAAAGHTARLAGLLAGEGDTTAGTGAGPGPGSAGHSAAMIIARGGPANGSWDMEKEQLKDEVVRLRAELGLLEERGAGRTSAVALELQQSLREAHAELARLRAEVVHLNAAGQAAAREQQALTGALEEARLRLKQQDQLHAALVCTARQSEDSSLGVMAELQARRVALEGEVSSLNEQLGALRQQVAELLQERRSLEGMLEAREQELREVKASILEQGADIRSALSLLGRTGPALGAASTQAPASSSAMLAASSASALESQLALWPGPSAPAPAAAPMSSTSAAPAGSTASALAAAAAANPALAAALAPYQNAAAAIGSALAAAAAITPVPPPLPSSASAPPPRALPPPPPPPLPHLMPDLQPQTSPLADLTSALNQWPGLQRARSAAVPKPPSRAWASEDVPPPAVAATVAGPSARGIRAPQPAASSYNPSAGLFPRSKDVSSAANADPGPSVAPRPLAGQAGVRWADQEPDGGGGGWRHGGGGPGFGPGGGGAGGGGGGRAPLAGEALMQHAMRGGFSEAHPRSAQYTVDGGGGLRQGDAGGGGVGSRSGAGGRLAALRRDMRSLEEEFADMEASLALASRGGR
ncbi:hypothetical protein HYH03_013946 [Edaphochlamys debaryana]|uniref:Uncharacterized protein n=1 Tax=Edaphochlamys debaryana TaxID=47281 RepID=A0A836BSR1_9CHLO|nr:hypothetical protein HYH03_013946 [Edaphochlamys debaryana]|eukprot:KAG2487377.1 hypothetical protein HYH03_013946 [Edaphochlamys debaryana]